MNLPSITLERLKVASAVSLSPSILHDMELHQAEDYIVGTLVYKLSSYLLADELAPATKDFTYSTWASWWQHAKHVMFPTFSRWLRRPPRQAHHTITVEVRNWATFPQATTVYPKELGPVRIMQQAFIRWDDDEPMVTS